jgi:hypothetical protein
MSVARFAFQACLIDRSSISPFRINNLQPCLKGNIGDCDKSSNVPRSLTDFSSMAASFHQRSGGKPPRREIGSTGKARADALTRRSI